MYGMVVCDIDGQGQEDVSFGNVAEIIETRTTNRIQPRPLWRKLSYGTVGVYFDFRVREDAGPV